MMVRLSLAAIAVSACVVDTTPPPPDRTSPPVPAPAPAAAPEPVPAPAPAPPPVRVPPATREVDWFPGFAISAETTRAIGSAEDVLGPERADCPTGEVRAIAITADLAPAPGRETIVASIAHGLVVLDSARRRIAAAALDCGGSADWIDAVALGRIDGVGPVIAVLATTGGHRIATTAITLFRVDAGGSGAVTLARVMTATIAQRDGDAITSGGLELSSDGLTYRDPDDGITTWIYDRDAGAFVPAGPGS